MSWVIHQEVTLPGSVVDVEKQCDRIMTALLDAEHLSDGGLSARLSTGEVEVVATVAPDFQDSGLDVLYALIAGTSDARIAFGMASMRWEP